MKFGFLKTGERLRNKMLLGISLIAIIPFISSGVFAIYLINQAHQNDVLRIERNLLNEKAAELDNFLSGSLDSISILNPNENANTGLVSILVPGEKASPGNVVVTTKSGERIKFLVQPDDLNRLLSYTITANHAFDELYFIDKSGIEVAYDTNFRFLPDGHGQYADLSKLPQFLAGISGNQYIGDVNYTLNGPVVDVATPVKNRDGEVIAVLAGRLNLTSSIHTIFAGLSLGTDGYLYLLDPDGNIIYNSNQSKSINVGAIAPTGGEYQSAWSEDVIGSAVPISVTGFSRPWLLVAEWPAADANQVINVLQNQFLLFLVLVLGLTITISIILANHIAQPIEMLEKGTERIASGSFDTPVEIKTDDELEDLGTAFNKMMDGLKQLQALKDEFVFIAAHELRTPVAIMKGYLELLVGGTVGSTDDTAKGFIKKVINANERLIQLVNDLLEVSRSDAGKLTIQVSAVEIGEPIQSVLGELKGLADKKSIVMNYEKTDVPKIMADTDRIKEVLVNLVGNAVKYSPDGGSITISHEVQGPNLVVHVKDTGFGISKEAQAKLFEKFYRVQTEKTRDIIGTGLGLFIVKQIIEKMNGKIWVESEEGKGSLFSFSLPIASS